MPKRLGYSLYMVNNTNATANLYEVFLYGVRVSRIAVVSAASILDAHDRAVELFPSINWQDLLVVLTTRERVLGDAL